MNNQLLEDSGSYLIQATLRYSYSTAYLYQNLAFTLPQGAITCILGHSGCGKSSLLKQLAGLLTEAAVNTMQVSSVNRPNIDITRQIAYMDQNDLLMPWLTVLDNVLLHMDLVRPFANKKCHNNKALYKRALLLLEELGLAESAYCFPYQLSGGMKQRAALARTLMQDKPIVLMDEPFSALDALTRYKLQDLVAQKLKNKTVLLITHDPQEALRLASQILLFPTSIKAGSDLRRFNLPITTIPREVNGLLGGQQEKLLEEMRESL